MAPLLTLFLVALVGLPLGKTNGDRRMDSPMFSGRWDGSGEGGQNA